MPTPTPLRRCTLMLAGCLMLAGDKSPCAPAAPPQADARQADARQATDAESPATPVANIYRQKCERCHGADGGGTPDGYSKPFQPDQSLEELTTIIVETMPEEDPQLCVGEEARQLARYIRRQLISRSEPAPEPRISRLTVSQYRNAVADVIGHFAPSARQRNETSNGSARRGGGAGGDSEVPGLRGDYYQSAGMNKAHRLGHYRSDNRMEFDFGSEAPVPSLTADQFAIIWQGALSADHTGNYEFRLSTENGARLYLNFDPTPDRRALRDDSSVAGQQALIDAWVGSGEHRQRTARVFLLGGRSYPIRLEFFKYLEDDASIKLEWKPPHGTWQVLDYNHTSTSQPDRVFVSQAPFPADDRSLGFERGVSASPQWQTATMHGAVQAASEVVDRLPLLAELNELQGQQRVARTHQFVRDFATVAFRRPLREDEQQLLPTLVGDDVASLESGVRRAVILVLMSPSFLYPDLTPDGEAPTPWTVASRLSFALWDSIPDAQLTRTAADGKLQTRDQIQSQASRMLRDPRAKAKMQGFFRHWLELEQRDLAKDEELYPTFDEAVVADLRRSLELFIDRVVWDQDSDYRELLRADYLMLNDRLAALYAPDASADNAKLDGEEIKRRARRRQFASEFQPVDFPPEKRSGILTHPYLLSAFAYHNNTSPIHRGVFLTRNIVGRALSPPPMAIAFKDDEFPKELTMREKVTHLTRDAACMSCHSIINPLGFTLENFDAVGRWRDSDNQRPVDPTSQYTTAAGATLQLASARDVANFAVESPSAHRAFVTHFFEHVVKRRPSEFRPGLVDELSDRFVTEDFNIQKLWTQIAALVAAQDFDPPPKLPSEN
ncbi:DUF1592 domain-containing protein [Roseiconus nitratireducens]|uniref:DUF1592 domain-containing protein n=1 Tax=Roseiconus nitratireducens TaxID=2605748 RepID=A0A5M6CXB7_9BACT|nr:DUF1592 domain-containing protein [Roseiconus nitratireducens]KAA5539576.1 DUF1592 domain-containing protein [Roseiconus nitratireducens]